MSEDTLRQLDAFGTPGIMLRKAREAQGISEREAADRLNLMPEYVGIIERDEYETLRSPAFARGYVRSYGRLLGLDEQQLLQLFDEYQDESRTSAPKRIETRPLQLQSTGSGVVVGLAVLLLLIVLLWWSGGAGAGQERTGGYGVSLEPGAAPVAPGVAR
ncbi:MAG: helix-turn-helix domain-containing protein [Halioglobus sp.]|nr:helix-turn-helix domain-containing protein [Halioglobus sp.]